MPITASRGLGFREAMSITSNSPVRYLPFGVLAMGLLVSVALVLSKRPLPLPVISQVGSFSLTNQLGQISRLQDLLGQVWVANIIFTRCPGPCREMSTRMSALQTAFATSPEVRFVSLTADPEFDTPAVLKRYSETFNADPQRWLFLTGPKADIVRLAVEELKLTAVDKETAQRTAPEDMFIHSTLSVLVDSRGRLRGAVEVAEANGPAQVEAQVKLLLAEWGFLRVTDLPAVNASLNAIAGLLLILGLVFILRGQREAHQHCMLSAFVCSCVFLICYVTHKILVRGVHTPLGVGGWILKAYHVMLVSHIILAITVVPLALITIRRGVTARYELHKKIARWTWPIWMYVSVTGVLIYFMLYHWFPATPR